MVGSFTRESPYLRPSIVQTTFVRVVIPCIVSVSQSVSQSATQSLIDPHSFIHSIIYSLTYLPTPRVQKPRDKAKNLQSGSHFY